MVKILESVHKLNSFKTYKVVTYYKNGKKTTFYYDTKYWAEYWMSMDKAQENENNLIDHQEGPFEITGVNYRDDNGYEWWEEESK